MKIERNHDAVIVAARFHSKIEDEPEADDVVIGMVPGVQPQQSQLGIKQPLFGSIGRGFRPRTEDPDMT